MCQTGKEHISHYIGPAVYSHQLFEPEPNVSVCTLGVVASEEVNKSHASTFCQRLVVGTEMRSHWQSRFSIIFKGDIKIISMPVGM